MGRRLRIPFKSQSVSRIMLFMFRVGVNQVWLIRACSSAWLERTPDKREVGSSSLPRPTIFARLTDLVAAERHDIASAKHWSSMLSIRLWNGGIAQLGERVLCKHEVVGSIPSGSTILLGLGVVQTAAARR